MTAIDKHNALSKLLSDPGLVEVFRAFPQARVVGGSVRDMLCGLVAHDFDLATPGSIDEIAATAEANGLRLFPTGIRHGTVLLRAGPEGDHQSYEVSVLSGEPDAADPWLADALQRDLTINALYLDRHGVVHDPLDGAADLAAGRIRFCGDAARRIEEDPLRILRFARFVAGYGQGQAVGEHTLHILAERAHLVGLLAVERLWTETKRILALPDPMRPLRLLEGLGALHEVLPEGVRLDTLQRLLARPSAPTDVLLRFAALSANAPATAIRLKASVAEQRHLDSLLAPPLPENVSVLELRRNCAETSPSILAGRIHLAGGSENLACHIAALNQPVFPLRGADIVAAGAKPGPYVGRTLAEVRKLWLQAGAPDDPAYSRGQLAELLARQAAAALKPRPVE